MIRLEFPEPTSPEWVAWRQKCSDETERLIASFRQGEPLGITNLYKEQKGTYMDRNGPFYGKCAYCESLVVAQPGDLDHYRPKNGVTDDQRNVVTITGIDGNIVAHPGYYWLAYDWRNLLPACIDCNRPRKIGGQLIGKSSCFPVKHFRAVEPGQEVHERPLIIHPVIDNPEEHLQIDSTGVFSARDSSEKGELCIKLFGLNDREVLLDSRRVAYREGRAKLVRLAEALSHGSAEIENLCDDVNEIKLGRCPYAAAARLGLADCRILLQPLADLLR